MRRKLPENLPDIAQRIRQVRKAAGYTIKDFSVKTSTPVPSISNYERGERAVSLDYANKLVTILGIDANWLLTGEQHPQKQSGSEPVNIWDDHFIEIAEKIDRRITSIKAEIPFVKRIRILRLLFIGITSNSKFPVDEQLDSLIDLAVPVDSSISITKGEATSRGM